MSSWNVTYDLNGSSQQQVVEADDLNSASVAARQLVSTIDGAVYQSVAMIPVVDPNFTAGIAKLVSLGLTEAEAVAVSTPSTPN